MPSVFNVLIGQLQIFREMFVQILCLLFSWVIRLLIVEFYEFFIYSIFKSLAGYDSEIFCLMLQVEASFS